MNRYSDEVFLVACQIVELTVVQPFGFTDLLWTAPELLRSANLRRRGTFCGDVYSFSIVVQEVVSRSTPFCMLDMPPKGECSLDNLFPPLCVFLTCCLCFFMLTEIINKVRKPPPLCRPIVSVEEAPLDVIQLVRQAWSEEPDKRPTFEDIFKQVGSLKSSFVL